MRSSFAALLAVAVLASGAHAASTMSGVDPDPARRAIYSANSGQRGVTAYSGAAYAPALGARGSIIVTGGGDADYWGNEVYRYDVATRAWTRLSDPSTALNGKPNADPQFDAVHAEYGDGTPASSHTYDHLQVVGDELYLAVSGAAYTLHRSGYAHAFDLVKHRWRLASTNATRVADHVHTTIYDERRNRIWRTLAGGFHGDVAYLDLATGAWTNLTMASSYVGYDPVSAYVPEEDLWLITSGIGAYEHPHAFQLAVIDLRNPTAGLQVLKVAGDVPPTGDGVGYGLRWHDGAAYVYRGWFEPQAMYRIVPPASGKVLRDAWTATRIPLVGARVPQGSPVGVFSRFLLIDGGRFAYVPSTTDRVVVWDADGRIVEQSR